MRMFFAISLVLASIFVVFPDLVFAEDNYRALLICTRTGHPDTVALMHKCNGRIGCEYEIDKIDKKYGNNRSRLCSDSLGIGWLYKRIEVQKY